ncbi:MAG TPA: YihY/virulence factor BrkB family protein [Usitatibacter sp.]|nr:YihY/virulence factor BrkB family protein [Usitatibacter sp.]
MKAIHPKTFLKLVGEALKGWKADNCLSMGAALAFYSLLSMGPLLVLVITLAGLIIGQDEAQRLLMTQMSGLLGDAGAEGVQNILSGARGDKEGLFQVAVSFVVLLIGATTVLGELQDDLNRIWKCEASKASGIWGQVRKRLLSFSLILAIGLLLLVSLALSAAVSYLGGLWLGGASTVVARVLELTASLLVTTALFAMTFKILPARRIPWGDVLLGSLMTAVLFAIGKYLIGLYIGKSAVASNFGAAGTVVVLIVWIYYSSQIFFLGAEFTRAYSVHHGSKSPQAANSEYGSDAAMVERARKIVKGQDPVLVGTGKTT